MHLRKALEGLALNPALPEAAVRRLIAFGGGLGELGRRQDLTPALVGEMIDTGGHWLLHSLALNPVLPHAARLRLAGHPDAAVRAALALRAAPDTTRAVFELLLADAEPTTREHLAQNDGVPPDLRERLAADPSAVVRATLGRWWPHAPEHVRRALLTDEDDDVRAKACATYYAAHPHPTHPPDLVPALLADPVTRAGAVRCADLDAETAERLAGDPDWEVRAQLARHPRLPARVRDVLGEDPCAEVRLGVFAREDTPDPVRAAIHAWIEAAPHPLDLDGGLDDEALELALVRSVAGIELHTMRLDWVMADPLPHIGSPYRGFRASAAASREPLPPQVVARLLADDDSEVRAQMARRAPHLVDVETAERIEREFRPAKQTRWRPADVLSFPPEVLRRFATDPDPRMRCLAPRDPDLPAALAAGLAEDPDPTVRREVAGHPTLPVASLIALLDDERTARAAAASPWLPAEQVERLLALGGL
ncbi:hypothetical protein [Lentzea sp. NPDC003310]|uniref:hypothetical protein n=1 Tax=Lentzea sp. NPDC003310 TaxID=3154447 RepID=UPI0033BA6663